MKQEKDLRGMVFGKWTVFDIAEKDEVARMRRRYWWCRCECGTEKKINSLELKQGRTTKCKACHMKRLHAKNTTHGLTVASKRNGTGATVYRRLLLCFWDPEYFSKRLSLLDYKCEICGRGITGTKEAQADHDHVTKKPRGILCVFCNSTLGYAQDSIERLQGCIDYLLKYRKENSH